MPVRMIFDSGQTSSGRAFDDCMHEAETHGAPIVRISLDGRRYDAAHPRAVAADARRYRQNDIAESSIVAILHYDRFSELFVGDAGESSKARLLASGTDLRADVLKSVTTAHDPPQLRRLSQPSRRTSRSFQSAATTPSAIPHRPRWRPYNLAEERCTATIAAAPISLTAPTSERC